MMDMRKILKEHNLGIERFAELIKAGTSTVRKYDKGDKTLMEKSKVKIEHGLRVLNTSNIVWPDPVGGFFSDRITYMFYQDRFWKEVKKCNEEFKKLL